MFFFLCFCAAIYVILGLFQVQGLGPCPGGLFPGCDGKAWARSVPFLYCALFVTVFTVRRQARGKPK